MAFCPNFSPERGGGSPLGLTEGQFRAPTAIFARETAPPPLFGGPPPRSGEELRGLTFLVLALEGRDE
jgi:hypothetical protein